MQPSPPFAETPERRAAIQRGIAASTGLDAELLEAFLREFYAAARADALLGPAFAGVADWEAHIVTTTRFWCSVALIGGGYHGNPLAAHRHLALTPAHFARWLALFERIARERLTPAGAGHLIERAQRIARSLEIGLSPLPLPGRKGEAA